MTCVMMFCGSKEIWRETFFVEVTLTWGHEKLVLGPGFKNIDVENFGRDSSHNTVKKLS